MISTAATPTTRRGRAIAAALALVALTTTSLLSLDLDSYLDAYYGHAEHDDVDYYSHRELRAKRPWELLNPHSCSARPQPTCNGVLITSQGGVGSSAFIAALEHHVAGGSSSFCTNDDRDVDGFKHRPSHAYQHNSTALFKNGVCFSKVLVILGDPIHTIESTYRRFHMVHVNKLRVANGLGYFRGSGLTDLYGGIAASGTDLTGITPYVTSWDDASHDDAFPEVRMVTAKTLFNNAVDHARWIGVDDAGLSQFSHLSFDPAKQHKTEMTVADEEVRERVAEVFGTVDDIVRRVEEPSEVEEPLPESPPSVVAPAMARRLARKQALWEKRMARFNGHKS